MTSPNVAALIALLESMGDDALALTVQSMPADVARSLFEALQGSPLADRVERAFSAVYGKLDPEAADRIERLRPLTRRLFRQLIDELEDYSEALIVVGMMRMAVVDAVTQTHGAACAAVCEGQALTILADVRCCAVLDDEGAVTAPGGSA